jgi:PAS domain S-box-containing protein
LLKDRPYNLNQLAEILKLNYRTVKHHINVLLKNEIVGSSSTGSYGDVYFLTPEIEGNLDMFEEIVTKFNDSAELANFTNSPQFFQRVIEQMNDAVIITDKDDRVFFYNKSAEDLFGYNKEEIIGEVIPIFPDDTTRTETINKVRSGAQYIDLEMNLRSKNNEMIDVHLNIDTILDEKGNLIGFFLLSRSISERIEAQKRHLFTIKILERLNSTVKGKDLMKDLLESIKEYTGFAAVGIRLKHDIDFPYYVTEGFPGEFVEAERFLCSRDKSGNPILDSNSIPVLECMCGNVIRGRTDPAKSFYTKGGSFWTNDTNNLLEMTDESDRGGPTRNRCNANGFRTVVLVPLRKGGEIIGLLQMNDKKPDRMNPENIKFFEDMGASIGIAFSRLKMDEFLKENKAWKSMETD